MRTPGDAGRSGWRLLRGVDYVDSTATEGGHVDTPYPAVYGPARDYWGVRDRLGTNQEGRRRVFLHASRDGFRAVWRVERERDGLWHAECLLGGCPRRWPAVLLPPRRA